MIPLELAPQPPFWLLLAKNPISFILELLLKVYLLLGDWFLMWLKNPFFQKWGGSFH
jgi:hypothetical protein